MSECNGNCSSCGQKGGCDSPLKKLEQNKDSKIKKVIGIVSGKGGVGKSLTTASLASVFQSKGYKTAIIDGDITGASIPNMFGLENGIASDGEYMIPAITKTGIKAISINLLLETPDSPVVWRGSMLSNVLKQFWTDVIWGDLDYMFVDMPPGTGDVPLTVFQSIPVDGIIIVTSPQELVSMIEELLCVSDICISDYSSIVFEYSLFGRPMLFYAYDLEDYFDWRGFYYPYYDLAPGPVVRTNEEIIHYIQNIEHNFDRECVRKFREKFMAACDGHATERILQLVFCNRSDNP